MKIFKKTKEPTETEKQLATIDEMLAATEPTSDDWSDLMNQREKVMSIAKTEAETEKARAEAKGKGIDYNEILKIGGTIVIGVVAAALSEGKIQNGPLWQKFIKRM